MTRLLINEQRGTLFAIMSGTFYGLTGYFGISIIHEGFSIPNMLFWRFLASAIFIALILLLKNSTLKDNSYKMLKIFFYGAVFYGICSNICFLASKYISTGLVMVIFFTFPAMVMFCNRLLFKITVTKFYYYSIFIVLIGLVLLVDVREFKFNILGIILGLLAALFYTGYVITSKQINLSSPLISTFIVSIGCGFSCFFLALLDHSFIIPNTIFLCLNILGIGIICTALPILFMLEGLKYISAEKVSILAVLEPVFVVIFGVLLLDEKITWLQSCGIIVILSGASLTLLKEKKVYTVSVK